MSLNDYRWGRRPGPEEGKSGGTPPEGAPRGEGPGNQKPEAPRRPEGGRPAGPDHGGEQRPGNGGEGDDTDSKRSARDLDAEWKSFNDMLQTIWGKGGQQPGGGSEPPEGGNPGGDAPKVDRRRRASRVAGLMALIAVFAVGAWLGAGFYSVPSGQKAALYAAGKFKRLVPPGTHWHVPWPFERVRLVDMRLVHKQQVSFSGRAGEGYLMTSDGGFVRADAAVQWKVAQDGVCSYLEHMANPGALVESALRRAMRQEFADMTVRDVLGGRAALLQAELAKQVQAEADGLELGVRVESVTVTGASLPDEVARASRGAIEQQSAEENSFDSVRRWAELADAVSVSTARAILEAGESYRERVTHVSEMDSRFISYLYREGATEESKRAALSRAWTAGLSAALPDRNSAVGAPTSDIMAAIRALKPPKGEDEKEVPPVTSKDIASAKEALERAAAARDAAGAAAGNGEAASVQGAGSPAPGETRENTRDRREYLRNRGR
ncbi:MAG: SPFH domain-containing protein [Sutterellaceae bacterium]|nr:SPFH domain-containing protein [Sutterellaceae bacterium]MDD7441943.1 SPFH domain-containing protein [Sutterellaceae bacterium]MDY2867779.1 SPFH domain-containing protein [Mesosutterella sp.]